jgi:hypothetical protein
MKHANGHTRFSSRTSAMDFLLEPPFNLGADQGVSSPPLGTTSVPQNGNTVEDQNMANMRAQWEANYASMDMPPPPPGYYETREDMCNAAKNWADANGYKLVIGHSSKNQGVPCRAWLACELGGVYRNRHHLTPEVRKRKRESRKLGCPMRILGTKKKYEDRWFLHLPDPDKVQHNHGPISAEDPVGPAEYPELEQALFAWHQQNVAEGVQVHGNTLKSKAQEFWKTLPCYRNRGPLPELGNNWLNDYRRRNGLPVRPTGKNVQNEPTRSTSQHQPAMALEETLPINPNNKELFKRTRDYVKGYMSGFDGSHDFNHILRVVALCNRILTLEAPSYPAMHFDPNAIFLAA